MPPSDTVIASQNALDHIVEPARQRKRWDKYAPAWLDEAIVSRGVLHKFWTQKRIRQENFENICKAVGIDWKQVVEIDPIQLASSSSNNSWVGRKELIDELGTKLRGDCRVLILTGITGIGKSALAARLTTEFQETWTKVSLEFDSKTIIDFASVAADLLWRWNESITSDDRRDPLLLLNRLLRKLQEECYILILNSVENLLQGDAEKGWSEFQDKWWENFFNRLLEDSCQSKIIITSQDLPRYFDEICFNNPELCHYRSLNGFTKEEQLEFFDILGLDVDDESGSKSALEKIGELFEGHPLGLRVIAGEIIDDPIFNGDAAKYWQKYGEKMLKIKEGYNIEAMRISYC